MLQKQQCSFLGQATISHRQLPFQAPGSKPQAPRTLIAHLTLYGALTLTCLLAGLTSQGCGRGLRLSPDELAVPTHPTNLVGKPERAWRAKLPTPPTALLPLGPHALLITTCRGELYRLNLETGKRDSRIRKPFRKAVTAQKIAASTNDLYVASAQDRELRAYDLTRGKTCWKRKAADVAGPLALTEGLLLTASVMGEVAAYETGDGRRLWKRRLPGRIYQGVWGLDSLALVLNDDGTLYAFELRPESGRVHRSEENYPHLWRRQLPVSPGAVMAAGPSQLIIGDSRGQLLRIDPANGETIFQVQLDAPIYSRPLVTDSVVVVATAAGEIIALKARDGLPVWRAQGEGLVKHPLLMAGGYPSGVVLVPFARGRLLALDLVSGRELWRYEMERPVEIVCLTPDGVVVADRLGELFYLRMVAPNSRIPE